MALNFNSEKWSARVELEAQEASIASQIAKNVYTADASGGKIVHAGVVGTPTIGDYVKGTPMTYTALAGVDTEVAMDKQKYFAFPVEDIDVAQSVADFKSKAMTEAGIALALEADKTVFGLYGSAGFQVNDGAGTPAALGVNSANVEDAILAAKAKLDEKNAGPDRALVVSSRIHAKLLKAGYLRATGEGDAQYTSGKLGNLFGFAVYLSNSLTVNSTTGDHCLALTTRAVAYAESVDKVESLRLQEQFGDAVRGLFVYGAKVQFADELVDIWVKPIAEA